MVHYMDTLYNAIKQSSDSQALVFRSAPSLKRALVILLVWLAIAYGLIIGVPIYNSARDGVWFTGGSPWVLISGLLMFFGVFGLGTACFLLFAIRRVFTMVIDIEQKTYNTRCGVFPIKYQWSGILRDFQRLEVRVGKTHSGGLIERPTHYITAFYRNNNFPYDLSGNGVSLFSVEDPQEAEACGKQLSQLLDIPFILEAEAQTEAKNVRR